MSRRERIRVVAFYQVHMLIDAHIEDAREKEYRRRATPRRRGTK